MVHAFVTVRVGPDAAVDEVVASIRELAAVETAHVVAGDVDVIAELEVEETYQAMEAVTDGIRSLAAVTDTTTYITMG